MFPGEPDWIQLVVADAVHLGVGGRMVKKG